ncbi:YfcC family protein [Peptoniphilus sp. SGI.035]|uniref:YfcC family protein n=1 Tax=Peptoniphilus sp. SGI.035 TaxID=3420564 RepID=UPI003D083D8D
MKKNKKLSLSSIFSNVNPLTLLFVIVVIVSILTHFIPSGEYDRVLDEVTGKTVVVADTFKFVEADKASITTMLLSFDAGIQKAAPIISFLLLIGGSLGVITSTGAIESLLNVLVKKFNNEKKKKIIIAITMFFFLFCSSSFGMGQEMMAFAPFIIILMVSLGFDTITAIGTMILGYAIGYGSGFLNPFNLAVAQDIAGLPYPSGLEFRIILSLILYIVAVRYMINYANKVERDFSLSISPNIPEEFKSKNKFENINKMSTSHKLVWLIFVSGLAFLIYGATMKGFYLSECATIFLTIGLLSGIVNKYNLNKIFQEFSRGAKDMAVPCLIIGFAMSITTILDSAKILDSIVYYLSLPLKNLPPIISAGGMVIVQTLINFFVNSGSTQAAITMPIISPLAQVLGVNQQVAVLAFQLGDGLSNMLWVTCGTLMIGLGIGEINYINWFKFIIKIYLVLLTIGVAAAMFAQYINYGPF